MQIILSYSGIKLKMPHMTIRECKVSLTLNKSHFSLTRLRPTWPEIITMLVQILVSARVLMRKTESSQVKHVQYAFYFK